MVYDFAIYGSGISAKITAIALAKNNFSVCLISDIDINQTKSTTSNLVTFLSTGSINYLQNILNFSEIFNKFETIKSIICEFDIKDRNKPQTFSFNENQEQSLGKIINNNYFDDCLNNEIENQPSILQIKNNDITHIEQSLSQIQVMLQNNTQINATLFILSSTKNKSIVKNSEIQFIEQDFNQDALSILFNADIEKTDCAFQKFSSDSSLALLPFQKNQASVVWSIKRNSNTFKMNNNELQIELNKKLKKYVKNLEIINTERHKLKFRYAKKLFKHNIVLIGNIAHNIHPIAGQGLNLSIKDIALFVKIISKYRSIGYVISHQLPLQEFDQQRKFDNTVFSFGTFTLNNLLTNNSRLLNFITGMGLGLVQKNNHLKDFFVDSATSKNFFKYY